LKATFRATSVAIGRIPAYALAAAGEAGVFRLLELLEIEIRTAMTMIGVKRLAELWADHLEFCGVRGSSDRPSPLLPADIVA
jgi:isopentenyl diphosphate isomerase/L-lactate dehydrogenase-like FMN-dependent dehydrogenase